MNPTKKEAIKAIPDVIYAIDQCMALHVWKQLAKPKITNSDKEILDESIVYFIENSVVESALLFIRKLNEFFGTYPQKSNDVSLRAYHFGNFKDNGWFLTKTEYDELHIRVGHISVEEVRNGKKKWPIHDYVQRALLKSCAFLDFLYQENEIDQQAKTRINLKIKEIKSILNNK